MASKKLKLHFLITAGGTREYIDPVRYISNASSGRMGYALAQAAIKAGHKVTLITAPTNITPPPKAKVVNVVSADDMFKAVKKHFRQCDCLIMAAAVSDYTPAEKSKVKRKKEKRVLTLKLKPTEDILAWAGKNKTTMQYNTSPERTCPYRRGKRRDNFQSPSGNRWDKKQLVIGFALEDRNLKTNAQKKLITKNADMIIANTPVAIGAEKSSVYLKTKKTNWKKLQGKKESFAGQIIEEIIKI